MGAPTGIAGFYIFLFFEKRVSKMGGKCLSTNFIYLLFTVGANLLAVLRSENQRTWCFLSRFTVVGIGLLANAAGNLESRRIAL